MPLELYKKRIFEFNLILDDAKTNLLFCHGAVGQIKTLFSFPFIK